MAPEQARGESVDQRADLYAAALLAWRLATGRVPFGRHQKDEYELLRAMRNPHIPPLSTLRPDLPEPLLDAVAQALEPERERRTITAGELADVVRAHIDVSAGWLQLASLLERWKGALERTVKRTQQSPPVDTISADTGGRVDNTLRYEEVALAFDDDAPADGPTFEAHALPSDPAVLAAMPLAEQEPLVESPIPPPAPLPTPAPSVVVVAAAPAAAVRPERSPRRIVPALVLAFVAAGLVAALLATFAR
jgi:serine/threonine-protein kinase